MEQARETGDSVKPGVQAPGKSDQKASEPVKWATVEAIPLPPVITGSLFIDALFVGFSPTLHAARPLRGLFEPDLERSISTGIELE